jgi:hypothetical protein
MSSNGRYNNNNNSGGINLKNFKKIENYAFKKKIEK